MYQLMKDHTLPILLLLISLTGLIALTTHAPATSARSGGGSALRLRLKVQNNTLRSGGVTKIFAEFLDRDYQQVANDGTRVIEFGLGPGESKQTGSGDISPQRVTVRPGSWSAEATFASRQPGRVLITAHADGLVPAQTLLVVTPPGASLLSGWFETVAYAHSRQIAHLDIHPGNIIIGEFGEITLIDWGKGTKLNSSQTLFVFDFSNFGKISSAL